MFKKIVLAILPKFYWIIILFSTFIFLLGKETSGLFYLGFNILIFQLSLKLGILIHEIGHLFFAYLVGGSPRRLTLGKGFKIFDFKWRNIKIIMNSKFNSGLANAAFNNTDNLRIKLWFYIAGGLLLNLIVAGILYLLFNFSTEFNDGIHVSSLIVISNLLLAISFLFPYRAQVNGLKIDSDGLSLFRIPFRKIDDLIEMSKVNDLLDAYDLMEQKKYNEAIGIYETVKRELNKVTAINTSLSICYLKLGESDKALELLEELLPHIEEENLKKFQNIIYNSLGWTYLIMDKLEEANHYSQLAYQLDSKTEDIRGTRGAVLIEKGHYLKGINLIKRDVDFNYPNSTTLMNAIYIALGYYLLGKDDKALKYRIFIVENLSLLDFDENYLYQRAKNKWEMKIMKSETVE
ncbi:tetratricopeptide repeat protein [Flammeovirga sp. MY04]|uniref:site-2 protease family protein n=1 Tax=Flammeovirga sp. MY04 TaxID=1191459 RepID=UPI0008062634|nr:site-2 protease family protein [Flammeovirga sp. MY04]ANQ52159.1 tetratricopeptide repeat protein [Flammeovirga sp. MY04]